MFLLIIMTYALVIFIEIPTIFKENNIKKVLLYLTLLVIPLIIDVLLSFNVEIPSPSNGIKKIVFMIIGRQ